MMHTFKQGLHLMLGDQLTRRHTYLKNIERLTREHDSKSIWKHPAGAPGCHTNSEELFPHMSPLVTKYLGLNGT